MFSYKIKHTSKHEVAIFQFWQYLRVTGKVLSVGDYLSLFPDRYIPMMKKDLTIFPIFRTVRLCRKTGYKAIPYEELPQKIKTCIDYLGKANVRDVDLYFNFLQDDLDFTLRDFGATYKTTTDFGIKYLDKLCELGFLRRSKQSRGVETTYSVVPFDELPQPSEVFTTTKIQRTALVPRREFEERYNRRKGKPKDDAILLIAQDCAKLNHGETIDDLMPEPLR